MGSQIKKVEVGERAGSALGLVVRSTTFCVCVSSTSRYWKPTLFATGQCSCGTKPGSCPFQSRLAESHRCLDLPVRCHWVAAVAEPALESDSREEARTLGDFHVTEFVLSSAASCQPWFLCWAWAGVVRRGWELETEADRELMGLWAPCTPSP